jgi:uncharacterized protein YifN (PemK superfamily)
VASPSAPRKDEPAAPLSGAELDELCARHGLIRPSRRRRLINSTPRVAQYFWVDFPHDAYAPEFVNEHPGIVVRAAQTLDDTCIIVPVTSSPQIEAKHIHRLKKNPNPNYPDRPVWAVCNHFYTIHTARLRTVKDSHHRPIFPRVAHDDMEAIYGCIRHAFPNVFPAATATVVSQVTSTTTVIVDVHE